MKNIMHWILGIVFLTSLYTVSAVVPYENYLVNSSTTFDSGIYNLSDSGVNGVIIINANNTVITCNNTLFKGSNTSDSIGVNIGSFNNITINNCSFSSYNYCIKNDYASNIINIKGGLCNIYRSTSTSLSNKTYGIYTKASNFNVSNYIITGYESNPRVGAYDSYWKGTGIYLVYGTTEYNFSANNVTTSLLSTGISVNGVTTYGGTVTGSIIENSVFNNFTTFGAVSAPLKGAIVRNNKISLAGTDSLRIHGNDSLVYNNTFNTSGHKRGIDNINNNGYFTAGWNHTFYNNTITSTRTNINTKTWFSPSYTDCTYYNWTWCYNGDGDISIAIRGQSDGRSFGNLFINIEDNDTTSDSSAAYAFDKGDYTRNWVLENDTFINVSGVMWYVIAKNITIKNSYICKSPTGNTKYPYDLLGAGDYGTGSNNVTTITIINLTKCTTNSPLKFYYSQNNRTNMTIYQNSSYYIVAAGGRGGYYTLVAQQGFNDLYNGTNNASIMKNFVTYSGYIGSGQSLYVTNADGDFGVDEDTIPPVVNITHPLNNTVFYSLQVPLNATATDETGVDKMWYRWNAATNYTFINNTLLNFTTYSSKYIVVYANDTDGNIGSMDVWFYVANTTPPLIENLSTNVINNSAIRFEWDTTIASNSSILYGLTSSLGSVYGVNDAITHHNHTINGLAEGTLYYYNVSSTASGVTTMSGISSVSTINYSVDIDFIPYTTLPGTYIDNNIQFSYYTESVGFNNVTIRLYREGILYDSVTSSNILLDYIFTDLPTGTYTLNGTAYDLLGRIYYLDNIEGIILESPSIIHSSCNMTNCYLQNGSIYNIPAIISLKCNSTGCYTP